MSDADRIEVTTGLTGSEAPNQPMYEGFAENEQEAPPQGQAQPTAEEGFEVPDKFMLEDGSVDVAALAASYQELERAYSQPSQEQDADEMSNAVSQEVLSPESLQRYTNEVQEHGDLTEESYAAFEANGIPREMVSEHVEGVKARSELMRMETLSQVGGQENYDQLTSWAMENLSDPEIDAYDATMHGGDPHQINMAIQGLYARYQQANGTPNLLSGDTGQSSATNSFRSWAEVTDAMRDPRYHRDAAYRQDVTNRLNVSDLNG